MVGGLSEQHNSGIAVSSSASSGTSDITDPGSPFSTSSDDSSSSPGKCKVGQRCKSEEKSPSWSQPTGRCRSEEKVWTENWDGKQQSEKTDHNFITPETDFKMAPNVPSASSPCDIWTTITETNTANDTARYNHFANPKKEAISTKRLKSDAKDSIASPNINNNIVVSIPSPIISEIEPEIVDQRKKNRGDNCEGAKVKIRRSSYECAKNGSDVQDNGKTVKNGPKTCEKSVGCVARPKVDRNCHQGKITEYFKSQIKSLVGNKRDFGLKKDVSSANKPKSTGAIDEPPSKKSKMGAEEKAQMDLPVFVKPSPRPLQMIMPLSESSRLLSLSKLPKAADFLLKKPAETKTLFNKILQNHKNRKLAESYMKCRTVSKPKPSAVAFTATEVDVSKPSHKPYETSTRNNVTEMPNSKIEEFSSNLEDNKVQSKDLDSNLLNVVSNVKEITNCDVISGRSDAAEPDSSKSPILSAPTTIRFPPTCHNRQDKHRTPRETISCRWDACTVQSDSASGLLEHLQAAHVLTQVSGEKFVCLWVGCKVFDQKSCSRSWLERHVLSHAGNKPYRCIVDGCGQGFSTQAILERHVNNHFAADVKKALDNSVVHKLFRRNGKKLRYRRQPWSARMFDFFDSGIMERLEHRLVQLTKTRTGGDIAEIPGKSLALTSQVIGRRVVENDRRQFLLHWFPEDIIDDEWVDEKDVVKKKIVSIPNLSPSKSSSLQETLELATRAPQGSRKNRRKNKGYHPIPKPVIEETKLVESIEPLTPTESMESPKPLKPTEPAEPFEPVAFAEPSESVQPAESDEPPELDEPLSTETVDDLPLDVPEEEVPEPSPPKNVPCKKIKTNTKKRKRKRCPIIKRSVDPKLLPAASVPLVDVMKNGTLTTEKTVSLRPKEEAPAVAALPEEMSVVPVCPPAEEVVPVQTGGILVDGTKLIAPLKTEMIVSSPIKLVTSQYIEQPFVQTVMPVQMPVTYQIPIVKLSQTSGMFFPQVPNYIIPPSPPVFPPSMPAFRNGFQFSTTGTIQIQASSTTLQQTASTFMQSTNTSGFQIVQSPAANVQQNILAAFQNSGMANVNVKSPTLRLLNCQPLILNNAKPMTNVSMTLTNMSSIAGPNTNTLTLPTVAAMPMDSSKPVGKAISVAPMVAPRPVAVKKFLKQTLNILPKPNISQKSGVADGSKNQNQCLQPSAGATT